MTLHIHAVYLLLFLPLLQSVFECLVLLLQCPQSVFMLLLLQIKLLL